MTDTFDSLDGRIRATIVELANAAPTAPTADELGIGAAMRSYASPEPTGPSLRTRIARWFAAIGLLAGGSGLAVVAANQGDDHNTPEAAFEAFAQALADEDAIGLLESIDPNERETLRPVIEDALAEFSRIGLLDSVALDAEALASFDFDVIDLEVASTRLGDGLAAIRIVDGRVVSLTQPTSIPIGQPTRTYLGPSADPDLIDFGTEFDSFMNTVDQDIAREGIEFVAVERGGQWYISLGYSVLDVIAKTNDWGTPTFAAADRLTPNGQASPEAVLEAWLSTPPSDIVGRIALVDPNRVPALYDYAAVIRAESLAAGLDPGQQSGSVERLVTSTDGNRVFATDFAVRTTVVDRYGESNNFVDFDGTCLSLSSSYIDATDAGAATTPAPDLDTSCVGGEELEPAQQAFLENFSVGLSVVERDGAWFVDPFVSIGVDIHAATGVIDELDDNNVDTFTALLLEGGLVGDLLGARVASASIGVSSAYDGGSPTFSCQVLVYDAVYDGQPPDIARAELVRTDYESCVEAGVDQQLPPGTAPSSFERVVAEIGCQISVEPLYEAVAGNEPIAGDEEVARDQELDPEVEARYEEIARIFTACMADANVD